VSLSEFVCGEKEEEAREREEEISLKEHPIPTNRDMPPPPKLASLKDAKTGTFAPKIPSRRKLTQNVFEEERGVKKERGKEKKKEKVELVASGRRRERERERE
jgi:hypothetical protein